MATYIHTLRWLMGCCISGVGCTLSVQVSDGFCVIKCFRCHVCLLAKLRWPSVWMPWVTRQTVRWDWSTEPSWRVASDRWRTEGWVESGFVSLCDDSNLDILWQILSCLVTTFCSGHVCYEGRQLMTCPFCYYFCDMTILVTGVADNLSEDVFLNVKLSHCVWYWRKQCLYVCAAKSGK